VIRRLILVFLLTVIGTSVVLKLNHSNTSTVSKVTELKPGFYSRSVEVENNERSFLLYIPDSIATTTPVPLVFFLHGGGGSMEQAKSYQWQDKADEAGFVLVLPNGTGALQDNGILATWNAGECCGSARDRAVDDVGFIREIVKSVTREVVIDNTRIYATGMSNGGMMSYRLACEASDLFAAIASVAGTDGTTDCSPTNKISVLHIHAKDDTHVLFDGGAGPGAFNDDSKVMNFTSVPNTVDWWVDFNKLDREPVNALSVSGARCDSYYSATTSIEVQLCVTETGEHSWPGSTVGTRLRGKEPSNALNANDVIWDFFREHKK
jgi:polyhydroxybutyrate depolymerase